MHGTFLRMAHSLAACATLSSAHGCLLSQLLQLVFLFAMLRRLVRAASFTQEQAATQFVIFELFLVVAATAELLSTAAASAGVALRICRRAADLRASRADQGAAVAEKVVQP